MLRGPHRDDQGACGAIILRFYCIFSLLEVFMWYTDNTRQGSDGNLKMATLLTKLQKSTMHECCEEVFWRCKTRIRGRGQLKCDDTRAEIGFRLSEKWMSPFQSAGASVQSTTGSRCVCISGSSAGYIMFRGSVKGTGYPLHSPVSPSLPLPCVTVCNHVSTEV